jgi:hypothetical protein
MAGPSRTTINQELFFVPDASTQHSYAYFPLDTPRRFDRLTVYILFGTGTTAGTVQLQSAPYHDYPGSNVWANEGSAIAWAAADSTKALHIDGVYGALRLDITVAVANGTIRAWVIGIGPG